MGTYDLFHKHTKMQRLSVPSYKHGLSHKTSTSPPLLTTRTHIMLLPLHDRPARPVLRRRRLLRRQRRPRHRENGGPGRVQATLQGEPWLSTGDGVPRPVPVPAFLGQVQSCSLWWLWDQRQGLSRWSGCWEPWVRRTAFRRFLKKNVKAISALFKRLFKEYHRILPLK